MVIKLIRNTIWLEHVHNKVCPRLAKGITTDILIIGGGIAGISTAFELKDSNKSITLIDRNQVGSGVSARTTGKLTFLQDGIYQKLEKNFGEEVASLYLKSQIEAIETVKQNVIDYHIDCDFEGVNDYLYTRKKEEIPLLQKEEFILSKNKISYEVKNKLPLFPVIHAIEVKDTAVFHPVKYILALKEICLKKKIKIYENTTALRMTKTSNGYLVHTEEGYIKAKQVIVCSHYPFFTIPGMIPFRTHIERSYLCSGKVEKPKKCSAINPSNPVESFRYHNEKSPYLLYVGGTHMLGNQLNYEENFQTHLKHAKKYLKEVDYIWQNQDIMTPDSLPIIGKMKKEDDSLFLATGFNTWGMTNGVIAGTVLSDLIQNKKSPYEQIFSPSRGYSLDKIKNLVIDDFQNAKSYFISKVKDYYSFYLNQVKISKKNGKKVGIYVDSKGEYHIVSRICPHLKCSLTFNMAEKTWDCPCHGSRFHFDGTCIEGPSVFDIKIRS